MSSPSSQHVDERRGLLALDKNAPGASSDGGVSMYPLLFGMVGLALDLSFSTYSALVGWYGQKFQSRTLFTFMMLVFYGSGLSILLVQAVADANFTTYFGAERAYVFRICFTLLITGISTFFLPSCSTQWQVLSLGALCGALSVAGLSSTLQLSGSAQPLWTRYVSAGLTVASFVPLASTAILDFGINSDYLTTAVFCGIPGAIQILTAVGFLLVSFTAWGKAQMTAAYSQLNKGASIDEWGSVTNRDAESGVFFSLFPQCTQEGVASCYLQRAFVWFLEGFSLALFTYAGGYELAARLMLARFTAVIGGALCSLCTPIVLQETSYRTPPAIAISVLIVFQTLLLGPLFGQVYGLFRFVDSAQCVLLISFGAACFIGRYVNTEIAVRAFDAVAPHVRHALGRGLVLINLVFLILGLFAGHVTLFFAGITSKAVWLT